MPTDQELLRDYTARKDETAFAEVVRRHTNLVYSVAFRVAGETHLAQDVAQTVFTKLAHRSERLRSYATLVGWLHTTTRHAAIDAIRREHRRQAREQEAFAMQESPSTPEANWAQLRPILDEAVSQLRKRHRDVVLMRFFQGMSHRDIGVALGLSEEAARKTVDRALEKLRSCFARQGVPVSSTLLAAAISAHAVEFAPVGLAATLSGSALAGAVAAPNWFSPFIAPFLAMTTTIKTTVAIVIVIAAVFPAYHYLQPAAPPLRPSASVTSGNATTTGKPALAQTDSAARGKDFSSQNGVDGINILPPGRLDRAGLLAALSAYAQQHKTTSAAKPPTGDPVHVAKLRAFIAKGYAPLFQRTGIATATSEAVTDAILERELALEISDAANPNSIGVTLSPGLYNYSSNSHPSGVWLAVRINPSLDQAVGAPYDAEIKSLLTDEQFKAFGDYRDSLPLRTIVDNFQKDFLISGVPLTQDQSEKLIALMFQNAGIDMAKNPLPDTALANSRSFLSQDQVDLLTKLSKVTAADAALIGKAITSAKK